MVGSVRNALLQATRAHGRSTLRLVTRQGVVMVQRPVVGQQMRSMSVFSNIRDTVTQKMQERNDEKQADAYRQQVHDLAHSSKFDLDSFYEQLKKNADAAGMNGWRSMIPGVSEMTAVQQLKAFVKIVEAIEPEHRQNPRLINGKVKRQISEKSGHSAEEINNMLRNYDQLFALRCWLVKRVERGLPLPDNMQETQALVREDPTGFPAKLFRVKSRRR
ncbi:hypothetical protein Poli38472_005450 [Pythium oligandrum]|uniref:Signal recognition particle SRP54 subunit M-domain domain-containing protein n=1 Tax=Pythium oligandrum TaxID=41045 RepID=A0A8K1CIL6_PYTOL|nr:hypothetical protein Poli38472_005450 [Pythium oligandrum]|eukprot:TMW62832.1 hypothetical protein Poli38472_005450 [Pythium oligandrum]